MSATPILDRYLATALQKNTDPVAAKDAAVAHLEDLWYRHGDRTSLRELRAIDAIYARTQT